MSKMRKEYQNLWIFSPILEMMDLKRNSGTTITIGTITLEIKIIGVITSRIRPEMTKDQFHAPIVQLEGN